MWDRVGNPFSALRKRLREGVQAEEMALKPILVADISDATLIGQTHRTIAVALAAANTAQPVSMQSLEVRDVEILAGPKADGVTPNVGLLFLAPNSNPLPTGWPLGPGEHVGLGPTDLSEWYVVGANAGDVLRILYVE
jgi:hypothetical protein